MCPSCVHKLLLVDDLIVAHEPGSNNVGIAGLLKAEVVDAPDAPRLERVDRIGVVRRRGLAAVAGKGSDKAIVLKDLPCGLRRDRAAASRGESGVDQHFSEHRTPVARIKRSVFRP
jgi:hypothetical protein